MVNPASHITWGAGATTVVVYVHLPTDRGLVAADIRAGVGDFNGTIINRWGAGGAFATHKNDQDSRCSEN